MNKQPLLIQDTYDFGPPPTKSREAPWAKLYRFFFGDDVFISYSRADAIRYVPSLAARLSAKKHICFFDQLVADPNEDLPEKLKKKILRSTVFVLVGTKGAVASSFVRKEIELFRHTRRPFIPVDVDGALIEQEGWRDVVGVAKIREEGARVRDGDPSPEVVNLIKDSFRYTRRSQWLRASLLAGVSFILLTTVASLLLIRAAQAEAAVIKRQADSEVTAANKKVGEAQLELKSISAEADRLKADADDARNQATSAADAADAAASRQKTAERSMRQAHELERQSSERAADTARREAGSRAALLSREPNMETDALALAVGAAEQSIASSGDFPNEVMDGIAAAADAVDYSLPLEDVGGRQWVWPVISPNGEKILEKVFRARDQPVRLVILDGQTGKRLTAISLSETLGTLGATTFSGDGKWLAIALWKMSRRRLVVWDLTDPQPKLRDTACNVLGIEDIALDSDGSHILISRRHADWVSSIAICEVATGREEVLEGMYAVSRVAFTHEDKPAIYGPSVEHGVNLSAPVIHFPRSGRTVALKSPNGVSPATFEGFGDDGSIITIARNLEALGEDYVYVQSVDGNLRRFAGYHGHVTSAAFADGQARVVTVSGYKARVADMRISPNFVALRGHVRPLDLVSFSPDDRTVLTVGDDGKGRLWDARTGHLRHTLAITDEVLYEGQLPYYRTKRAAFRADGARVVTANERGEIQTWDVDTGRPVCPVPAQSTKVGAQIIDVSFLAGGHHVLAVYYRGDAPGVFVNFLDARTCRLAGTSNLDERIKAITFSRDGTAIIGRTDPYLSDRPELKSWSLRGVDLRSGSPVRLSPSDIKLPPGRLYAFLLDGTRMLAVTEDVEGRLLVSGGGSPVRLEGWRADLSRYPHFVLSADGTRVAAISWKKAQVWDTNSGKLLVAFECDQDADPVIRLSLSSDGSMLVVTGRNNTVRIYPTSRQGFLGAAKRMLGR
jgi:WD40 repeat protein